MHTRSALERRIKRVRSNLARNISSPRLSIHRTLRHIWAQIIDDNSAKTLLSASTKTVKAKGSKTEQAQALGEKIAQLAIEKKITNIRFDRGQFKYHGRVKAVAESARKAGLKF